MERRGPSSLPVAISLQIDGYRTWTLSLLSLAYSASDSVSSLSRSLSLFCLQNVWTNEKCLFNELEIPLCAPEANTAEAAAAADTGASSSPLFPHLCVVRPSLLVHLPHLERNRRQQRAELTEEAHQCGGAKERLVTAHNEDEYRSQLQEARQ